MKKKSKKLVKSVLLAAVLSLFGTKSASAEPIAVNNDMDGTRSEDEVGSSVFKNVLAKVTKSGNVIGINNHRSHTSHRSHSSHRSSNTGHASHYSSTPSTTTTTPSTTTRSTSSSSSSTSSSSNSGSSSSIKVSTPKGYKTYNIDVEDTAIYTVVMEDPEFPGGIEALNEFIQSNLQYPKEARDNRISGKVYLTFVIEKDGSITNPRILRDIGGGCGEDAIRMVKLMPKWIPGRTRGKAVRCQFNLPINFSL